MKMEHYLRFHVDLVMIGAVAVVPYVRGMTLTKDA